MTKRRKKNGPAVGRHVGRVLLVVLETLLLLVLALYAVMYVLAHGPSPRASREFAMTVRETSALKFLAGWYFSDEEIAAMEAAVGGDDGAETDTSLISLPAEKPAPSAEGPQADAWGLVDDDGDGIVVEKVSGQGFYGYMMVVYDARRVIMGSRPNYFGRQGFRLEEMVQHYDAVAGVNAGGFYDPGGMGDGSIPDTMVVFDGEIYYAGNGVRNGFAGLDGEGYLHVASNITQNEIKEKNIRYGVCFGPVLVQNGEAKDVSTLGSGLNPRTAIGQRSDGAILLLVIAGRQATSAGARYQDLVNIMLAYGAVNACNMDGGSSSLMFYNGDYLNDKALVIGERTIPTTWLVLKEGASVDG